MIKDLVLRKYPHRRFYDSARSTFLRLDEIAELIKAGARVTARDRHGRDIAAELYASIIVQEQARARGRGPLTVEAMRMLICLAGSEEPAGLAACLGSLAAFLEVFPNGGTSAEQPSISAIECMGSADAS